MGVGILGPGAIGACHARAIRAAGGRVVAVAGPKPDENAEFSAEHDIPRSYVDTDELLADDEIDAVVVAAPSPVHAALSVAALRAGKHVLCEIPAGVSLAEAELVARIAAETGRHAAMGHTLRFWAPHLEVRARVERGELRLRHIIARSLQLRQSNVGWTGRTRDWTDSVLWHHGAHLADTALWLLDATEAKVYGGCGPDWPGSGGPMDVGAVLVTPSGDMATLSLSYHSREPVSDYVLIAEDQTLHINDGRLYGPDGVIVDSAGVAATQDAAIEAQDADFLAAVTEGRTPRCTVADVLPAMRVLDALEHAS
ncbi:Gfo/Idh/MocA family oxidoreductase [Dactylosporangium sp. AC04546]|uniref:Gfo/Idh/MocA family protein n=1 Tax=Dactylosporangium sp. AC04546 TaxID=2862460 RepID=UPI001EDE8B6B|nr:Gfo/Idh/MocA family oxidoreductase [Dactylosporangium sp. AC04546]WVK86523.1 Gfo/Idh/MocA family oxidoreductase [Dactylosporangium sp. AC04546]